MTKVYGTGTYDFKRHRVAEYPVEITQQIAVEKTPDSIPISNAPNSISLSEIKKDPLTKIAADNWIKSGANNSIPRKPFNGELVKEIYTKELLVKSGRKPVPLQRVMILEISQYLENYLWPYFDPATASFEHFRENVAAWVRFHDGKDVFKAFLERVLQLKDQILDSEVFFSLQHDGSEGISVNSFQEVDDACVLYCERFLEFIIDLSSQLPTRRNDNKICNRGNMRKSIHTKSSKRINKITCDLFCTGD